jgi:hypothetical protein
MTRVTTQGDQPYKRPFDCGRHLKGDGPGNPGFVNNGRVLLQSASQHQKEVKTAGV